MRPINSSRFIDAARDSIGKGVVGREPLIERLLISLTAGGHLLLQGPSGLAKTRLVTSFSRVLGLHCQHVQFSSDLLVSDLTGSELPDDHADGVHVDAGPIFTNVFLASEICRSPPKVQNALFDAMFDRQVRIGNGLYLLPTPFMVIATQNPFDPSDGPDLSMTQLDHFLLCCRIDYPDASDEAEIVRRQLAADLQNTDEETEQRSALDLPVDLPAALFEQLEMAKAAVREVYISDLFTKRAVELVRRTRDHRMIETGAGPRASIALALAARARAYLEGRDHAILEDLYALAEDALRHRIRLTRSAIAEGKNAATVLKDVLANFG